MISPGRIAYDEAHALQQSLLARRIAGEIGDVVVVCEHDPVFTVGRKRGAGANVLDAGDVPVVEVERGGDVTWHGPGQVVAYPIFALEGADRDLHAWLRRLEQLMIDVCADFGLEAGRDPRNSGAWVAGRKLGHVGVACRRWVTWHGLSLNVDVDLGVFRRIHPCGMPAEVESSMAAELGRAVPIEQVKASFIRRFVTW